MELFGFEISRKSGEPAMAQTPDAILKMLLEYGSETGSGIMVTPDKAMHEAAAYACGLVISEGIAQLPFILYREIDEVKTRAKEKRLYSILHDAPNEFMTSFDFRMMMQWNVLFRGNAYAYKNVVNGELRELLPLHPDNVTPKQDEDWTVYYEYRDKHGKIHRFEKKEVFHIMGLTLNGYSGVSPITYHRETVGLSLSAQRHGARTFKNGAKLSGVLTIPSTLKSQQDELRKQFNDRFAGSDSSGKAAVLTDDMKWTPVSMTQEDAQYLESRNFQRKEIAGIFRVPLHMINDLEHATFSNVESLDLQFAKYTLTPHCCRWEQAIKRDLMKQEERAEYYAELLMDGILRGDYQTRTDGYQKMIYSGIYSPNEVRRMENKNPRDGGDEYYFPLNMIPSSQVGNLDSGTGTGKGQVKNLPLQANNKDTAIQIKSGEMQAAVLRQRIQNANRPAIRKAAEGIVEQETDEISAGIKDMTDSAQILEWIDGYYRDVPDYIKQKLMGAIQSYAEMIGSAAADEIGADGAPDDDLKQFVDKYVAGYGLRHANSSKGQLVALAKENGDESGDVIRQRLDEWRETRPGKIAMNESVRVNGAVTKMVFAALGVTYIKWLALGNKSCPYCQEMNGKIIDVQGVFLNEGEEFEPDGANGSYRVSGPTGHPPLHRGCQCSITAVQGV